MNATTPACPDRTERFASLDALNASLTACARCARLVEWRERVGRERRAAYRDHTYHAAPVPGFGDPSAPLVIVGLAPGAHGSNRTGRVFTGDSSGDFLYAALHRAGLANQPTSRDRGDGLELRGAYITAAARCAPPANKPAPEELRACRDWLHAELEFLPDARVILALGRIAHDAILDVEGARRAAFPFAHAAEHALPSGRVLLDSYHVSRQNTQTGRLTPGMFDAVLERARALLNG